MLKFLFLVILGIILYPVIRIWLMMRRMRRGLRKVHRQAANNAGQPRNDSPSPKQSRVISDMEEDAEFEIVDGPRIETAPPPHIEVKDQVTDAEFEDV